MGSSIWVPSATELGTRINIAWGRFHSTWPLLKRRCTSLQKRKRLFDANVGRSILWCCESWTLTIKDKQRLQSTERAMLRRFAAPKRQSGENYIQWLRRATHTAELARDNCCIRSWNAAAAFKKWSWAGHVARMVAHRWALRLTCWRDSVWWSEQNQSAGASVLRPMRARAGDFRRWEQKLCKYARLMGWAHWRPKAQSMSTQDWNGHCSEFVKIATKRRSV